MAKKSKFLNDLDFLSKDRKEVEKGGTLSPGSVQSLPLDRIRFDPGQPRKSMAEGSLRELADSIARHGVLEPILVRPEGEAWILVCGERRVRAAHLAGLAEIPAVVRDLSLTEVRLVQLIENIQREDLPPLAIARAIDDIMKTWDMTQEACAKALGKSQTYVSRHLALLQADTLTTRAMEAGLVRDPEAVTLLNRMDPEAKKELLSRALDANTLVSVRTVREELERIEAPVQKEIEKPGRPIPKAMTETPTVRSEEAPPYGSEIPIEETKTVKSVPTPGDSDPVVAVRLSLSVWKKVLERLGLDPEASPEDVQALLERI